MTSILTKFKQYLKNVMQSPQKEEDVELRKLSVNGHSLAVTIPMRFIRALQMKSGDNVEVFILDNNTIAIRRHNTYGRNPADNQNPEL